MSTPADTQRSHSGASGLRGPLEVLVGCLLCVLVLNTWFVDGLSWALVIEGDSMAPTLSEQQRLLVDRSAFAWRTPRRFEVVAFHLPKLEELCVKRIVGLPGEVVERAGGEITIDGRPVRQNVDSSPDLAAQSADRPLPPGGTRYRLAADEYFVLGDNSPHSLDSRIWPAGSVRRDSLLGPIVTW